ncbi:hypothetical protein MRX96_042649 [Rhipicephalus microplus]
MFDVAVRKTVMSSLLSCALMASIIIFALFSAITKSLQTARAKTRVGGGEAGGTSGVDGNHLAQLAPLRPRRAVPYGSADSQATFRRPHTGRSSALPRR